MLRSGGEFLCALVPLVPAAGAHMGGGDAGGAHQVSGQRRQDTLRQGAPSFMASLLMSPAGRSSARKAHTKYPDSDGRVRKGSAYLLSQPAHVTTHWPASQLTERTPDGHAAKAQSQCQGPALHDAVAYGFLATMSSCTGDDPMRGDICKSGLERVTLASNQAQSGCTAETDLLRSISLQACRQCA